MQVHLHMPWRTSKGWNSEKAQAQDKALNKACQPPQHRNAPVIPRAQLVMALPVLRHSRQFSPTALLNPTLFWSSQRIYPLKCAQKATTAPAFQSQTNSPSTAQVSSPSSISVIASPLDFLSHSCTVITKQHHSQLSHIPSTSPV